VALRATVRGLASPNNSEPKSSRNDHIYNQTPGDAALRAAFMGFTRRYAPQKQLPWMIRPKPPQFAGKPRPGREA